MQPFLPNWGGTDTQLEDFSFGTVATQCAWDTSGIEYTFRLTHMQRREFFGTGRIQKGYYLHVRLQGLANAHINGEMQVLEKGKCSLFYMPECTFVAEIDNGIGSSLMINISPIIAQYATDIHIKEMLAQTKQRPDDTAWLYDVYVDHWLAAIINLLLNAGKDSRNRQDMHGLLHKLLRMYLNHLRRDLPQEHRYRLQLQVLTGVPVGKSYILEGGTSWESYQHIILYLTQHIKNRYHKKVIIAKSDLKEAEFSRLFRDGYGKPFKEGYTELRMMQALEWVVADRKLGEVAQAIGYRNFSGFSKAFKNFFTFPASLLQWPYYNGERGEIKQL